MAVCRSEQLYVIGIKEKRLEKNCRSLTFHTTRGNFEGIFCTKRGVKKGVILLGNADNSLDGPSELYSRLASELLNEGIASLRLNYRIPGDCVQAGLDALLGVQYLDDEGVRDLVMIGWSFGGAVALAAGSIAKTVRGIITIATSDISDCCVGRLRAKPTLLIHGDADKINPVEISKRIHSTLNEPRELIIYSGGSHDLNAEKDTLVDDIKHWVADVFGNKS